MSHTPRPSLVIVGLLALAVAGCGNSASTSPYSDDTPTTLSKAQFIEKADVICGEMQQAFAAIQAERNAKAADLAGPQGSAVLVPQIEAIEMLRAAMQRSATALRALRPPAEEQAALDPIFGNYDEGIRHLEKSANDMRQLMTDAASLETRTAEMNAQRAATNNMPVGPARAAKDKELTAQASSLQAETLALQKSSKAFSTSLGAEFDATGERNAALTDAYGFKTC